VKDILTCLEFFSTICRNRKNELDVSGELNHISLTSAPAKSLTSKDIAPISWAGKGGGLVDVDMQFQLFY
jgi:hypothetical protein